MTQDALFADQAAAPATGTLVVAATDGSARPNPGRAAGAWFVDGRCWQAVAVEGTSTNNVGELVAMRALLGSIADSLAHQVQSAGAAIELGALPDLVADKLAVEQVFANLIENALKYGRPDRPVRIQVAGEVGDGVVHYSVADNGRGIAERDRERVFELFRRAGDQTVPGEGIGLAHVRALVRRLGGSISFESVLNEGTTFHVRLPPLPPQPADEAA